MLLSQIIIYTILGTTLCLFIYGRWRYDIVAVLALMAATLTGLVLPSEAFLGFGHPAVVTVAAVLALSVGLQNAGMVYFIYRLFSSISQGFQAQLTLLCVGIAIISGFINNIGALAILLPITMQTARNCKRPPSQLLMAVAFSSLLGGMVTMIGTPPNIIVALLRKEALGTPFGMFDFTPVGLGVAISGVAFLVLLGWRLNPSRKGKTAKGEIFKVEDYEAELRAGEDSSCVDKKIKELEAETEGDVSVIAIVRKKQWMASPSVNEKIKKGDILVVETDSETLQQLIDMFKLEITADSKPSQEIVDEDDMMVGEVVVMKNAAILNKEIGDLRLKARFGIHVLAVSRAGTRIKKRLRKVKIQAGDVLLIRGMEQSIYHALPILGCLPLQYRDLSIGEPRRVVLSLSIFALAILAIALGYLQIQIAFVLAVVAMYFCRLLRLRDIYGAIDWPIIILLGALIPVGRALETTGAAQEIANGILWIAGGQYPVVILAVTLVGTMFLSDLVNNATAAILMVPVALNLATGLGVSPDPLLMGVAVGASCPFLTPIGHQCNTIIWGPGGYRFGDYWRVGLPLEAVIATVAIPLILLFWPFY